MSSAPKEITYGLGAEFNTAHDVYEAAKKIRDMGFKRWDVHTPYPMHGLDAAMGITTNSKVSLFSLIGGCTGLTTAFLLIFLTSGNYTVPEWFPKDLHFNYPLIVNGKPYFAFEPSVPIFFELTILLTAFFTIFGLLVLTQMPRWNHPVFEWDRFAKVTDDKFFIVIEATDPRFSEIETREVLESVGGQYITLIKG